MAQQPVGCEKHWREDLWVVGCRACQEEADNARRMQDEEREETSLSRTWVPALTGAKEQRERR